MADLLEFDRPFWAEVSRRVGETVKAVAGWVVQFAELLVLAAAFHYASLKADSLALVWIEAGLLIAILVHTTNGVAAVYTRLKETVPFWVSAIAGFILSLATGGILARVVLTILEVIKALAAAAD